MEANIRVVHAPTSRTTWFGGIDVKARKKTDAGTSEISVNDNESSPIRLVASGSHRAERDEKFAKELGEHKLVRMGSSLKACVVAEGSRTISSIWPNLMLGYSRSPCCCGSSRWPSPIPSV